MIIPHEIVPKNHGSHWQLLYYVNNSLSHEMILLYLIAQLHIQEKINDKRRNAMIANLRSRKLIRKIGTFHCEINDKWYNDESTFGIFCEAFDDTCKRVDLTIEQFLPYIALYTNKNRNYNLNFIFYEYIKPLLDNLSADYNQKLLKKFNIKYLDDAIFSYEDADRKYDLGAGYCCEDCDGCYYQYKKYRYHYNYEKYDTRKTADLFINHLNSLKVGRWQLAPNQLLYI